MKLLWGVVIGLTLITLNANAQNALASPDPKIQGPQLAPAITGTPDLATGPQAARVICNQIRAESEGGDRTISIIAEPASVTYTENGVACVFAVLSDNVSCTVPVVHLKSTDRLLANILRDGLFAAYDTAPIQVRNDRQSTTYSVDNLDCSFNNATDAATCELKLYR